MPIRPLLSINSPLFRKICLLSAYSFQPKKGNSCTYKTEEVDPILLPGKTRLLPVLLLAAVL